MLIKMNYSLSFWIALCNILKMADVKIPNNRAIPAKDIPFSFINRSAISDHGP
jgi:hypothetical protein